MTRIAIVIPTLDQIGGAERQVLLLAKELAARKWQVTIVALSGSAAAARELRTVGVNYLSLKMRKAWIDPSGWLRYLVWAFKNQPDILHAHLPHATFFARGVRLLAPVRVLVDTIHTTSAGSLARRLGHRLSSPNSSHITCVSQAVAIAVEAAGVARRRNLTVLHNGIAVPSLPTASSRNQSDATPFRWIAVGRLAPVKDYPTLLRAFASTPGNATLQIVGSGPEEQNLRNLAAALNIETRVQFAGFQSPIQPLLAHADAFVQSSLWEGLPMSVLEASAASLPVVVTDAAGVRETMRPGETGIVVPIGDIPGLVHAMTRIMNLPPERRLKLGENGRAFVESQFSLSAIVNQWEQLFTRLLDTHPDPSRRG